MLWRSSGWPHGLGIQLLDMRRLTRFLPTAYSLIQIVYLKKKQKTKKQELLPWELKLSKMTFILTNDESVVGL